MPKADAPDTLLPKRAKFVAEYLIDLNATQAAIRAGYSPKSAEIQGCMLLRDPKVAAAVAEGKSKQLEKADLSAMRVLEELRRLAFVDLRGFYDESGYLKPLSSLTPEQGAVLAGVETMTRNLTSGDNQQDVTYKIKVYDKVKALDLLAKHFGLLVDRMDHSGEIVIRHEIPD